jgi:hypothetical protein
MRVDYPRATIFHRQWVFWYVLASFLTAIGWRILSARAA